MANRSGDNIKVTVEVNSEDWNDLGLIAAGLDRSKSWIVRRLVENIVLGTVRYPKEGEDTPPRFDRQSAEEAGLL